MKHLLLAISFLTLSLGASAQVSSLYVKQGSRLLDVAKLVKEEIDVYAEYDYKSFCYIGVANQVVTKMKDWIKTDYFFSGGGGGYVLKGLQINRGIVTYDIVMKLEDEVVPGEFVNVLIKPCR